MSPSNFHYIADSNRLKDLCHTLGESTHLALDTEFVGEDSFVPRLELIQVAVADLSAVIDVPAVGSLDCFREVLANPQIEKVVHAGKQDLELLHALVGQVPAPVFDTQLAAAMVGYGTQVGYAQLVHRVVGTKLAKSHTFTNWSQRPLTQEQIAYALEDVHYLLPIREHLHGQLRRLGRLDWIKEEFAKLESSPTDAARFDPYASFPPIEADLSFSQPKDRSWGEIEAFVRAASPSWMESLQVVDRYEGPAVPPGWVKTTVRLTFRSAERTLEQVEVNREVRKLREGLEREMGAQFD